MPCCGNGCLAYITTCVHFLLLCNRVPQTVHHKTRPHIISWLLWAPSFSFSPDCGTDVHWGSSLIWGLDWGRIHFQAVMVIGRIKLDRGPQFLLHCWVKASLATWTNIPTSSKPARERVSLLGGSHNPKYHNHGNISSPCYSLLIKSKSQVLNTIRER